tara:strand:- start:1191 stop:1883 length:693 start_codon:yes stop_codon:yes gene_type:complete
MRFFYISDDKDVDATVVSVTLKSTPNPELVFKGDKIRSVRVLESTDNKSYYNLKKKYGDNLTDEVIKNDVDLDFMMTGLLISETTKTYLTNSGSIMNYAPKIKEVIIDSNGEEKEVREPKDIEPNIKEDTPPVRFTGKLFNKKAAISKFIFKKTIQLQHTNGLTYDYLYNMAKDLHDKNQLMYMGAGVNGTDPLIFQLNGIPMRGFLEGRVDKTRYQLLLHLSNMEIKLP